MAIKFDWALQKAESNSAKHGVSFYEAQTIYHDNGAISEHDEAHSDREDRFITVGFSYFGNLLTVIHTDFIDEEGVEIWWIISARRATQKERKAYGEQTKNRD